VKAEHRQKEWKGGGTKKKGCEVVNWMELGWGVLCDDRLQLLIRERETMIITERNI
jgi:hypothetical protein